METLPPSADKLVQLPLGISLSSYSTFDNLVNGPNAEICSSVRLALDTRPGQFEYIYIWGADGTGKSHLLQAVCHEIASRGQSSAYLAMTQIVGFGTGMLDGQEQQDIVCIDDIQSVANNPSWETALFNLFNQLKDRGSKLIITSDCNVSELGIQLADLTSRLNSGLTYKLQELDDEQKLEMLMLRCDSRGIELSEETARFILGRASREADRLCETLDHLTEEAINQKRRLTVPFVKSVLNI